LSAPSDRPARRAWLLVLPLAVIELVGSLLVRARVPGEGDLAAAAAHAASILGPEDAVVAAPRWLDPSFRAALGEVLGERLDMALAAPDGLEGRAGLVVLSVRGHDAFGEGESDAANRARAALARARLEEVRFFGRVRVQRFVLEGPPVAYDFLAHLDEAAVAQSGRPCPRTSGRGSGRGLGEGPVLGPERFDCGGGDAQRLAPTVIEDLELLPRACIAHRPGTPPITVTFAEVPLGERIVLHGGVHWVTERDRAGTTVTLRVRVGETPLGELVHRDGDGWSTAELVVPDALRGTSAAVTFEVEGAAGHPFCWSGRTLGGTR
jgi:hypothetical protein